MLPTIIVHVIALILGTQLVMAQPNIYSIQVESINGKQLELSTYKGKVLLIVNVASFCGYTKQYEQLETIFKEYSKDGLVILGFPSNEFGGQEPGTAQEIESFCKTKYDVTFPLFAKIEVNGDNAHPLYKILTSANDTAIAEGPIRWNFEKFLVDPMGKVVKRYGSRAEPIADILPDIKDLFGYER